MRTRTAVVSAGLALALLASPSIAVARGLADAADAAEVVVIDRADFYEPVEDGGDAVETLAAGRDLVQITDEMKYFTKYESHSNYRQGFSYYDGFHALGYYQFDRRYSLVNFMNYCLRHDAEKYAMFAPVVERADEVMDGNTVIAEYNDQTEEYELTEIGQLTQDAWYAAHDADPTEFALLQDNFAYDNYYRLSENYLASKGVDMTRRPDCVKGLVWSMTNLFGSGGVRWFLDEARLSNDMTDREFVNALVDALVENIAEQYPSQTQYHDSWIRRYENERADCLSMLPADPVAHRVSVTSATGGSVRASHSTTTEGSTVTVRLTAEAGYVAGGVTVTTATGASVAVSGSGGSYSFVMPDDDVTVCASFSLRFPDVRPGSWYFEAVSWAVGGGIFNGNDDGTFAPDRTITRAEMAGVLHNLSGSPAAGAASLPPDCVAGSWYETAVRWALSVGAFNGNDDGTFAPDAELTREQAAGVIMNMARIRGESTSARADLSRFPDAGEVSSWAADAMSWAVAEGIISGSDHGNGVRTLDAQDTCSRATIAAILMNWLEG